MCSRWRRSSESLPSRHPQNKTSRARGSAGKSDAATGRSDEGTPAGRVPQPDTARAHGNSAHDAARNGGTGDQPGICVPTTSRTEQEETQWVPSLDGAISHVRVEVGIAAGKADGILADEVLQVRVVVARPVVVEVQRFIVLAAREPIRGGQRRARPRQRQRSSSATHTPQSKR